MACKGQVIENPVAGDRLIFTKTARQTDGESLEFEIFAWAGASGTPEMVHILQDESFEVLSGSLDLLVAGQSGASRQERAWSSRKVHPTGGGTGAMRRPTSSSSSDRRCGWRSF